ncbi:MAG: hypothetical protein HQK93_09150, partial [Nitrospirae bacterium]|nr:hypothetical protein [Nitrospirota bacterium]
LLLLAEDNHKEAKKHLELALEYCPAQLKDYINDGFKRMRKSDGSIQTLKSKGYNNVPKGNQPEKAEYYEKHSPHKHRSTKTHRRNKNEK